MPKIPWGVSALDSEYKNLPTIPHLSGHGPSLSEDADEMPSMSEDKKFTEDLHSRKSDGKFIESSGRSQQQHKRSTK